MQKARQNLCDELFEVEDEFNRKKEVLMQEEAEAKKNADPKSHEGYKDHNLKEHDEDIIESWPPRYIIGAQT